MKSVRYDSHRCLHEVIHFFPDPDMKKFNQKHRSENSYAWIKKELPKADEVIIYINIITHKFLSHVVKITEEWPNIKRIKLVKDTEYSAEFLIKEDFDSIKKQIKELLLKNLNVQLVIDPELLSMKQRDMELSDFVKLVSKVASMYWTYHRVELETLEPDNARNKGPIHTTLLPWIWRTLNKYDSNFTPELYLEIIKKNIHYGGSNVW